jgi:hemoglobin-like flavoprotein
MLISDSLDRILKERTLLTKPFYDRLFKECPQFILFFSSSNFAVQPLMLMVALQAIVSYFHGNYPPIGEYLRYLGTRHRRLSVSREDLSQFCDVLIATVQDFHGDDWDENLANDWRKALAMARERMLEGYDQDFHV